jgi:hypothetical protein
MDLILDRIKDFLEVFVIVVPIKVMVLPGLHCLMRGFSATPEGIFH